MTDWRDNTPGTDPVCVVGAGFSLAVLESPPPSTRDLIPDSVCYHAVKFPILKCLVQDLPTAVNSGFDPDISINSVWRRLGEFGQFLSSHFRQVFDDYAKQPDDSRIWNVVRRLILAYDPSRFIEIMLEIELKRMVALQFDGSTLRPKPVRDFPGLEALLEGQHSSTTTWISLNYDTALEVLLQAMTKAGAWRYCFDGWFAGDAAIDGARHILAKPHGSVNVWFDTVWQVPPLHTVYFADPQDHLKTCSEAKVGGDNFREGESPREYRPWLVGYVPDEMKYELNSPGFYADAAHDLCKGNLAFAGLSLQKATSLYVLGYSMPTEDTWMWSRVGGMHDKSVPVYVASRGDTESIVNQFRVRGFSSVYNLSDSGCI